MAYGDDVLVLIEILNNAHISENTRIDGRQALASLQGYIIHLESQLVDCRERLRKHMATGDPNKLEETTNWLED